MMKELSFILIDSCIFWVVSDESFNTWISDFPRKEQKQHLLSVLIPAFLTPCDLLQYIKRSYFWML